MEAEIVNNQFGLGGQQDLYDYFSRGKKRGGKKKIKRIVRKIRKPKRRMTVAAPVSSAPTAQGSDPSPGQIQQPISTVDTAESAANRAYEIPSQTPDPEPQQSAEISEEEAYDYFFGGKKSKQKREERQALRKDKRQTKIDERRAGVERMRAETQMINQMGTPQAQANPAPVSTEVKNQSTAPEGENLSADYDKKSVLDEKKTKTLWIVLGVTAVAVVGSLVWMQVEKHKIALGKS